MATSKDNSLGYRTHVMGTVKPVLESNRIILYNKYQFSSNSDYSRISVYNIDRIYNIVTSSNLSLSLRKESDGKFHYKWSNKFAEGFNVIIYLSNFDNTPIGYTEFLRTQGKDRNINITIDLDSTVDGDIVVNILNSLTSLRNPASIVRNFVGTELWDFTSSNKIKEDVKKILPNSRYTTHLTTFNRDRSVRNIYLLNTLVCQENGDIKLKKLDITRDIEVDPFELGFTHYQISYFQNELALYTWNDTKFCIISLTERNNFNRPVYYTVSNDASFPIPDNYEVDYFAGPYIVCKDGTILDILSLNDSTGNYDIVVEPKNGYTTFIDPLDIECKIYNFPQLTYETAYYIIPELSEIYLDIKEYMKKYGLKVIRKIGSWFVIKRELRDNVLYLLVNQMSRFYLTQEDYDNMIILNDRVIMFEEGDCFLVYFLGKGEYWTERARATRDPGATLVFDPDFDVFMCQGDSEDIKYRQYFIDGDISRVFKSYPLYDSVLNYFRKNYYKTEEITIPKIIGACDGILFFITSDNKYLEYI